MSKHQSFVVAIALGFAAVRQAGAQPSVQHFEAGAQAAWATTGEFDGVDAGIGGRFAWYPAASIGLEAEATFYPAEYPSGSAISRARREWLGGITAGPSFGPLHPFGFVRAGELTFERSSRPFACILIYPPPLACVMGTGRALPAAEIGVGIRARISTHTFVRFDAGVRLLRFPAPAIDRDHAVQSSPFVRRGVRVTTSAGWRF